MCATVARVMYTLDHFQAQLFTDGMGCNMVGSLDGDFQLSLVWPLCIVLPQSGSEVQCSERSVCARILVQKRETGIHKTWRSVRTCTKWK